MTRRARRAAAGGALVLAACAGPSYVYDKPKVTPARLDEDLAACRKEAFRPSRFAIVASQRYDRDALNRCMERKGYTVRRED